MSRLDDCPKCRAPLEGAKLSCSCGWSKRKATAAVAEEKPKAFFDPDRHKCAWVADGHRCQYPGAISHTTHGGGPWYCRDHFHNADPLIGAKIVHDSNQGVPQRVPTPSKPAPMKPIGNMGKVLHLVKPERAPEPSRYD